MISETDSLKDIDLKDIKTAWKEYCRKLYSRVIDMEKEAERNYVKQIQNEVPYLKRIERIRQCEKYKKIIQRSAEKKYFDIQDGDLEIIIEKGWERYFRNYNGALIYD